MHLSRPELTNYPEIEQNRSDGSKSASYWPDTGTDTGLYIVRHSHNHNFGRNKKSGCICLKKDIVVFLHILSRFFLQEEMDHALMVESMLYLRVGTLVRTLFCIILYVSYLYLHRSFILLLLLYYCTHLRFASPRLCPALSR